MAARVSCRGEIKAPAGKRAYYVVKVLHWTPIPSRRRRVARHSFIRQRAIKQVARNADTRQVPGPDETTTFRAYNSYLTTKGLVQFGFLNLILEDVERYGIASDGGHSRRCEGGSRCGEGKEQSSGFDLHLSVYY